jgi:phosphopantothenoylcysteine decarboxylase / phosphopantothenate---cysteine ligase
MYAATMKHAEGKDIVVCTAAVADYKPARPSNEKIKKSGEKISLDLVRTRDILAELGKRKSARVLVGFALETGDLIRYAQKKLEEKNLDLIVANAANEAGSGFGGDTNRIAIIGRHNKITNFELKSKRDAARDIADAIAALLGKK